MSSTHVNRLVTEDPSGKPGFDRTRSLVGGSRQGDRVPEHALVADLRACASTQFAPGVVAAFLATHDPGAPTGAEPAEVAS
jgi:hypothetical protein